MQLMRNALQMSHHYIREVLQEGDTAIDATMGGGRDTLFLAGIVGTKGSVYSFDIQQMAIKRTTTLLKSEGDFKQVHLICDGHQNMDQYVSAPVAAVMFNLGYLPGSDHKVSTRPDTTIAAIEKACALLKVGGRITIAIYYGKDTGFEEKDQVQSFLKSIVSRQFVVLVSEYTNLPNCPPIAVCIEKLDIRY